MVKDFDNSKANEHRLREQLRREAAEARPPFSEALHRRMVGIVERLRMEKSVEPNRASPWGFRLAAIVAAACLLGVAVLGWRLNDFLSKQGEWERSSVADATNPSPPPVQLDQLDHLEHDARLAASMLLQRLPIDVELADEP